MSTPVSGSVPRANPPISTIPAQTTGVWQGIADCGSSLVHVAGRVAGVVFRVLQQALCYIAGCMSSAVTWCRSSQPSSAALPAERNLGNHSTPVREDSAPEQNAEPSSMRARIDVERVLRVPEARDRINALLASRSVSSEPRRPLTPLPVTADLLRPQIPEPSIRVPEINGAREPIDRQAERDELMVDIAQLQREHAEYRASGSSDGVDDLIRNLEIANERLMELTTPIPAPSMPTAIPAHPFQDLIEQNRDGIDYLRTQILSFPSNLDEEPSFLRAAALNVIEGCVRALPTPVPAFLNHPMSALDSETFIQKLNTLHGMWKRELSCAAQQGIPNHKKSPTVLRLQEFLVDRLSQNNHFKACVYGACRAQ